MSIDDTTRTCTRRQFVAIAPFVPLAICSYANQARGNPIFSFVLRALGRFAFTVAANVVSGFIRDYIKFNSLPAGAVDAIGRHHDEMSDEGFIHVDPRVYELTDPSHGRKLLFYGVGHKAGQNGCMVVSSSEGGVSCLTGPTIVGLALAAEVLHDSHSIGSRPHIALALLPRGPYDESGGFNMSYRSSYVSDGFSIDIAYSRRSYDPSNDTGEGDFYIKMKRIKQTSKNAHVFFERHFSIDRRT